MKCFIKMIGLIIFGLLTAIVIYPFLHETGHLLVAILVGARVVNFSLFPEPFIVCEVSEIAIVKQVSIGLGGIVFPFLLSMALRPKRFWTWYINLLLKGISVYSVILSIIAIVFHIYGNSWDKEDIVGVLRIFPEGTWWFVVGLCLMAIFGFGKIVKEKPILKCIYYFDESVDFTDQTILYSNATKRALR